MMRIFLSVCMAVFLFSGSVSAMTIDFQSVAPSSDYLGHMEDGFFIGPRNSAPFGTASGMYGNPTMAAFTAVLPATTDGNLLTYVLGPGNLPAQHGDAEFTFHGADLYVSGSGTLMITGLEGVDTALQVFRETLTFGSAGTNGTFQHVEFPAHFQSILGALEISMPRNVSGPAIVYGVDNLKLCLDNAPVCSFNPAVNFVLPPVNPPAPPVFAPETPTAGGGSNVPEPSSFVLLLVAAGVFALSTRKTSL
jgi:hypothetical protein